MEIVALLLLLLPILGLMSLLNLSLTLLRWFYAAFLRPGKDLRQAYGSWAVVTGATDGIGRAIAFELARRGLHLVLVGRSSGKLRKTSDGILTASIGTQIRTVVWDLAEGAGGAERLRTAIAGVDVGLVVNCAGATYPAAMYFHEVEERVWRAVVGVNVEGTSLVMRVVLPEMVRRRRGAVVNIGSASSVAVPSFPLYAVYAATKAYVNKLSRSLHVAYKSMGIDVQCQIPFYVATKMVSMEERPSTTFIPTPEDYAKAAVRCIGYEPLITPYWSHSIQWVLATCLPDFLLDAWRLRVGIRKRINPTK
ncbi:Very-long-chain 3-oxoacyl-CoA reductase 1 [Apostasia shenzhenica]|uniref:Very-long-chain 3-oxoacyl-CoA reductase 1 n=1 Tax=Apostasia shenzhenica TaxID=1088818 RepID=A0A2I0AUP1_9ASPA|nr:Very-long-chain 3-oxoacyl-CoA reductase 1 [Apostasia shenzhenica]